MTSQPLELMRFSYFTIFLVVTSLTSQSTGFLCGATMPVKVSYCDISSIYHNSIDYLLINTGRSPLSSRNTIHLDLFEQLMKLSKIRKYYYYLNQFIFIT